MSGCIEFGKCEVCGKEAQLQRTYWHYTIKCECHWPNHFEMKCHCADCIPTEPTKTKISLRTDTLEKEQIVALPLTYRVYKPYPVKVIV